SGSDVGARRGRAQARLALAARALIPSAPAFRTESVRPDLYAGSSRRSYGDWVLVIAPIAAPTAPKSASIRPAPLSTLPSLLGAPISIDVSAASIARCARIGSRRTRPHS